MADLRPKDARRVCVAEIGAAHGLAGEVRVTAFTQEPSSIADYGALTTGDGGRAFEIERMRPVKDTVMIVRFRGIDDRNAAEALKGARLYVLREDLPPPGDEEFYHADLIGLTVQRESGAVIGSVSAVVNYGAGDLLEIAPAPDAGAKGRSVLVPFTRQSVPTVDLASGRIVIDPPPGLLDPEEG